MRHTAGTIAARAKRMVARKLPTAGRPARPKRRDLLDVSVLLLLGAGLVVSAALVPASGDFVAQPRRFLLLEAIQLVFFLLASAWVLARRPAARWALPVILLVALAARLVLAGGVPYASSDIYRYVWDGRVQAHGINPYRYAPDSGALAGLRDGTIFPNINRRGVPTIYPPVAQAFFLGIYWLHPGSIDWTRVAFSLFDVAAILLIALALKRAGSRPERAILYAWHPLAIFEVGSGGHVDVLAVLCLLLALHARLSRRPILTGVGIAAAALVKYYALVAAPALLTGNWRRDLKLAAGFLAATVIAYLPYLGAGRQLAGFLPGYVQEEGFASGGRFYLLNRAGDLGHHLGLHVPNLLTGIGLTAANLYELGLLAVMGLLALRAWLRPGQALLDVTRNALAIFVTLLVLSTPTYPWYALLALSLLPFAGRRLLAVMLYASGSALLLYLQWWWPGQPHWPLDFVYGGGALVLVAATLSFTVSFVPWRRLLAVAFWRSPLQSAQEA